MGLTEILWVNDLSKSNNVAGEGSLCHFKGYKTPPRGKLQDLNIIANASPFKPVDVSPFTFTAPVGSSHGVLEMDDVKVRKCLGFLATQ